MSLLTGGTSASSESQERIAAIVAESSRQASYVQLILAIKDFSAEEREKIVRESGLLPSSSRAVVPAAAAARDFRSPALVRASATARSAASASLPAPAAAPAQGAMTDDAFIDAIVADANAAGQGAAAAGTTSSDKCVDLIQEI